MELIQARDHGVLKKTGLENCMGSETYLEGKCQHNRLDFSSKVEEPIRGGFLV